MTSKIHKKIEEWAGERIQTHQILSGGCIANAQMITMVSGRSYFLKYGNGSFISEANGLRELSKAKVIRIPNVLYADYDLLLLELITAPSMPYSRSQFFQIFGEQFAALHRIQSTQFGFYENNFIGATPQYNLAKGTETTDWISFYFNQRLMTQYRLAEKNGYVTSEIKKRFITLEHHLVSILGDSLEPPSLLHGDLWSGNFIVDEFGNPCLIDPAVYYGHREADLAITTLFGGFDQEFYQAYQHSFPLPNGHAHRQPIYQLYHVMNHLNLFGSGYLGQTLSILRQYT